MKKRILALALAATTAFSMLGSGLSVSAAAKWTDQTKGEYMKPNFSLYLEIYEGEKTDDNSDDTYALKTGTSLSGTSKVGTDVDWDAIVTASSLDEAMEYEVSADALYLYNYLDTTLSGSSWDKVLTAVENEDALALAKALDPDIDTEGTNTASEYKYVEIPLFKDDNRVGTLRADAVSAFKGLATDLKAGDGKDYTDPDNVNFAGLLTDIKDETISGLATSQLIAFVQAYNTFAELVIMNAADVDSVQAKIDALASRDESEFKNASDYNRFMADLADIQAELDKAETYADVQSVLAKVNNLSIKYASVGADKTELKDLLVSLFDGLTIAKITSTYSDAYPATGQVYVKADYATDDWNAFNNAYVEAVGVYKTSSSKSFQTDVDNMVAELLDAIDALSANTSVPNWLLVKIEEDLAVAYAKVEDDYTTASWKTLQSAITRAEAILDAANPGKAAAEAASTALDNAIKGLVVKGVTATEKKELKDTITAAEKTLKALDKTSNGAQYYALTIAINEAKALFTDGDTSKALVKDTTKSAVANAIDALNAAIDFSEVVIGWNQLANGTWMYGTEDGYVTSAWKWIGSAWYYFDANGIMVTGWQQLDGAWYYFYNWGGMAKGWALVNGTWYYLNPNGGKMLANGWNWIDGKCYYFYSWGGMAANTTIDGYKVDASGAWVK